MRCPIDVSREIAERSQDSSRVILIAHGMGLAFLPDGDGGNRGGPFPSFHIAQLHPLDWQTLTPKMVQIVSEVDSHAKSLEICQK